MPWLEPEPVCWAIDNVRVRVGPATLTAPRHATVRVDAMATSIDARNWLNQAVGDDELDDGRTVAQVVVGQADARPGRSSHPHEPLLTGQPSLDPDGDVGLGVVLCPPPVSHPQRLHAALDILLDGVVRTRGPGVAGESVRRRDVDRVGRRRRAVQLCRKMACGNGSQATCIRRSATPRARRRDWDNRLGDRHVSISVLVCGADTEDIVDGLRRALLTDDELAHPNEWARYADPFGDWHEDPCDDSPERGHRHRGPQRTRRRGPMKPGIHLDYRHVTSRTPLPATLF